MDSSGRLRGRKTKAARMARTVVEAVKDKAKGKEEDKDEDVAAEVAARAKAKEVRATSEEAVVEKALAFHKVVPSLRHQASRSAMATTATAPGAAIHRAPSHMCAAFASTSTRFISATANPNGTARALETPPQDQRPKALEGSD